jgi:hypothetical protein
MNFDGEPETVFERNEQGNFRQVYIPSAYSRRNYQKDTFQPGQVKKLSDSLTSNNFNSFIKPVNHHLNFIQPPTQELSTQEIFIKFANKMEERAKTMEEMIRMERSNDLNPIESYNHIKNFQAKIRKEQEQKEKEAFWERIISKHPDKFEYQIINGNKELKYKK